MSEEYSDPRAESEMRRRAAWFLGMLVLVAVLLITLMALFLHSSGNGTNAAPPGPTIPTGPVSAPGTPGSTGTSASQHPPSRHHQHSSSGVQQPPHVTNHHVSCPTDQPCIAQGDIGNAVAAINAYRRSHGVPPVDGTVSSAAQQCALSDGSTCSGSWAESQVTPPTGAQAVQQIQSLTNLLDPNTTSMEVGWAYDPGNQLYYFALIQNS